MKIKLKSIAIAIIIAITCLMLAILLSSCTFNICITTPIKEVTKVVYKDSIFIPNFPYPNYTLPMNPNLKLLKNDTAILKFDDTFNYDDYELKY
jgi:hypothetical protein